MLEKPVLESLCYDGSYSLEKIHVHMSLSSFPLKTYIHTRNYQSFPFQRQSPSSAVYFVGHLAALSFGEKTTEVGISPQYVTDGVVLQHSEWIVIVVAFYSELAAPLQHAETILPCKYDSHKQYFGCKRTSSQLC